MNVLLPVFLTSPRRQPAEGAASVLIFPIFIFEFYNQPPRNIDSIRHNRLCA